MDFTAWAVWSLMIGLPLLTLYFDLTYSDPESE